MHWAGIAENDRVQFLSDAEMRVRSVCGYERLTAEMLQIYERATPEIHNHPWIVLYEYVMRTVMASEELRKEISRREIWNEPEKQQWRDETKRLWQEYMTAMVGEGWKVFAEKVNCSVCKKSALGK